ncbi:serine acetyltransferase [Candidatus Methylopumilus universalis]|uniref:serine O-acetyltransferase n=1 Tax=Candidatus Methylopumilus universalis TaxID=2588536 RepID=UPI00111DBF4E|nr:serine acetyltransferase [Candidatus Methylopumilus universalis]QDC89416.1 serine acetyltransferase [Candidatus Methylopumilus universalis]QDC90717.1 serine acetyltransferase [Candidatus Methylopumilus universalis]
MNLLQFFRLIKSDIVRLSAANKQMNYLMCMHPRFFPVLLIRIAQYIYQKSFFKPLAYIFTWLNVILFGLECTPKAKIGFGLLIPHSHGIVIGAIDIGNHVTIFQGVTLGSKTFDHSFSSKSRPRIGNNVTIAAGAKVLGGITLGDNSVVAANAVVLKSVFKNHLVAGIPAKIVKYI